MCGWFHCTDFCLMPFSSIPDCLLGSIWWVSNQRAGRFLVWVDQWYGHHSGRRTLCDRLVPVPNKVRKLPGFLISEDKEVLGESQWEEPVEHLKDTLVNIQPKEPSTMAGKVTLQWGKTFGQGKEKRQAWHCEVCSLEQKWAFKSLEPLSCFPLHFWLFLLFLFW